MANRWKVIAIIFIILFLLESAFLLWAYNLGAETIEKNAECQLNICKGHDSYFYDDTEKICYCYIDNEISYWEYVN